MYGLVAKPRDMATSDGSKNATLASIEPALPKLPSDHVLAAIAGDLRQLTAAPDATLITADRELTRFLPSELDRLRTALEAQPVSLETIPPELARDWMLPDGRARVQVVPGAEAPKCSIETLAPRSPTQRDQPSASSRGGTSDRIVLPIAASRT